MVRTSVVVAVSVSVSVSVSVADGAVSGGELSMIGMRSLRLGLVVESKPAGSPVVGVIGKSWGC